MNRVFISQATEADLPALWAMNENALPHVGSLTPVALRDLLNQACDVSVARIGSDIAGFILALAPGQPYRSPNYRWFSERYEKFVYVDRIVVADGFKGQGIGRALYSALERAAGPSAIRITCEVNLIPPNPDSLVFHGKLGFEEVGQQDTESGKKRVALLAKSIKIMS